MKRLLAVLIFAAMSAWAQEHPGAAAKEGKEAAEQEHEMPNEIWWKWANFAILAGALGWLMVKYGGPFFQSRASGIREGIEEAHKVKVEAEAKAAEIESRIAHLSGAVDALRKSASEEIAAEGQRMKAETEAHLAKIQAHAEAEIASAAKTASQDLKAHAADLAIKLAEVELKARLGGREQAGLVRHFVEEVGGKGSVN
jgi:F-type H+-transporting ATPase subunit b